MAYTIDQLTTLQDAIAQGVLEVKYADKTVTYRSLNEMNRIVSMMKRELGISTSSRRFASFNKGLGSNQSQVAE